MAIVLFRIDERLIHGQVAHSWSVECNPTRLIVIDDAADNDPLLEMTLEMAVPTGKKFSLLSLNEAISYFQDERDKGERIFVIVKSPKTVLTLVEKGVNITSVNVGGMYYENGRRKISKTVYINEDEAETFRRLQNLGVEAEIRTNPSDKKENLYGKI